MPLEEDLRKVERAVEDALAHADSYLKSELSQDMPDSRVASWWVEVHSNSTMLLMGLQKLKSYYGNYSKAAEGKLNKPSAGGMK